MNDPKLTIGTFCYQCKPCLHDVTITDNDKKIKMRMNGKDILKFVDKYPNSYSGSLEHFEHYRSSCC